MNQTMFAKVLSYYDSEKRRALFCRAPPTSRACSTLARLAATGKFRNPGRWDSGLRSNGGRREGFRRSIRPLRSRYHFQGLRGIGLPDATHTRGAARFLRKREVTGIRGEIPLILEKLNKSRTWLNDGKKRSSSGPRLLPKWFANGLRLLRAAGYRTDDFLPRGLDAGKNRCTPEAQRTIGRGRGQSRHGLPMINIWVVSARLRSQQAGAQGPALDVVGATAAQNRGAARRQIYQRC